MRRNHVKLIYTGVSGSTMIDDPAESDIIFARSYIVNGVLVDSDWAEFHWQPFAQLWMHKLSNEERYHRHEEFIRPYEELLASYSPEDYLEETTSDVLVIPVSSLEVELRSTGTYADMAA